MVGTFFSFPGYLDLVNPGASSQDMLTVSFFRVTIPEGYRIVWFPLNGVALSGAAARVVIGVRGHQPGLSPWD